MKRIEELPNNGLKVLLMRRTAHAAVKTSVGYRSADTRIYGWTGSRPPTHYCEIPPFVGKRVR